MAIPDTALNKFRSPLPRPGCEAAPGLDVKRRLGVAADLPTKLTLCKRSCDLAFQAVIAVATCTCWRYFFRAATASGRERAPVRAS